MGWGSYPYTMTMARAKEKVGMVRENGSLEHLKAYRNFYGELAKGSRGAADHLSSLDQMIARCESEAASQDLNQSVRVFGWLQPP